LFLASALIVESVSIAIIAWVAFKILFIVWILASAQWRNKDASNERAVAPQSKLIKRPRFQLALNFRADDERFDLSLLDKVYNLSLTLGLLGAIIFWVNRLSNTAKGSAWFPDKDPFLIGPLLIPFAIIVVCGSICLYPFFHLINSVKSVQDEMAESTTSTEDAKQIRAQRSEPVNEMRHTRFRNYCTRSSLG
jgi:hypothetical protein